MTLRDYKPEAWVLYQRVIDQSKADNFIKPGIMPFAYYKFTHLFMPQQIGIGDIQFTHVCSYIPHLVSAQ
jgi:hypothetical protein